MNDDDSWRDSALCGQTDPEIFFPHKGESAQPAKRICQECTVRVECLNYALDAEEQDGVWGGYTARELRRFRRGKDAA